MAGFLVLGLAFAAFGRVEVTTRGRGILHPLTGIQVVTAQVGGTVVEVSQASGRAIQAGDPILRLDSALLHSQMLEAERGLELLESDFRIFATRMDRHYQDQETTLNARLDLLTRQKESQQESLALYQRKVAANETLLKEKLVATLTLEEAREALAQAKRQWMSNEQGIAQARQELAGLRSRREDDLWRREQEVQVARAKLDGLKLSLAQTQILAPQRGVLEAMLVKAGDVIQPGAPVGRIVPQGVPFRIVAFLPEKDRAFVKPMDVVRLELDQLPYAEFGTLKARVTRISDDLATIQEFQEAMGDSNKLEGPAFRVEMDLEPLASARTTRPLLRSGMLLNARFTLRRERPLTLLLDPLKRWLD